MKVLIIFVHPLFEKSKVNKRMLEKLPTSSQLTLHDLYETYPDFEIDIAHEKALLKEHDFIIWQHPMYWYSSPPLLKQWIDLVFEHGWAYGKNGDALEGKKLLQVVTVGAARENYCQKGKDRYTIPELFEPFSQTAQVCKMQYLPPYVIHGTHVLENKQIEEKTTNYAKFVDYILHNNVNWNEITNCHYTSDWFFEMQKEEKL